MERRPGGRPDRLDPRLPTASQARDGQATADTVPIAAAEADRDEDFVFDRMGDTVTVAGRTTVATRVLNQSSSAANLRSSGASRSTFIVPRGSVRNLAVKLLNGFAEIEVDEYRPGDPAAIGQRNARNPAPR